MSTPQQASPRPGDDTTATAPRPPAQPSAADRPAGLRVRTEVRAGGLSYNHSAAPAALHVRTRVRAGGLTANHTAAVARIG
jgi:hypothetical protein